MATENANRSNMPDRKLFEEAVGVKITRFMNAMGFASSINHRIAAWQGHSLQIGNPEPWTSSSDGIPNITINTTFYPVRVQTTFPYLNGRTDQKRVALYCFYNSSGELRALLSDRGNW